MSESLSFQDLLARVRAGDQAAAAELVTLCESQVRRVIRVRLSAPNLRRSVDPSDIFQSVLGNFFVRLVAGQFDLADPTDLLKLLVRMVRNKVYNHANRKANRDTRTAGSGVLEGAADPGETPSRIAAHTDLVAEANRRMTGDERAVAEQRRDGRTWAEIAAAGGTTPEAARKQFERAMDRVCAELGLG